METLIQEIDVFVRDFVRGENNQLIFTRAYYDRSETPINKPLFTLDSKGDLTCFTLDPAYLDLAQTEKDDQLIDAYIETCKEELETFNHAVLTGDRDYLSIFEHSDLYGTQIFHADYTLEARRTEN